MSEEETNYLIYLLRKASKSRECPMTKQFLSTTCKMLSEEAHVDSVKINTMHAMFMELEYKVVESS